MNPLLAKGRRSFIDRYATKSVAYEMCIWLLFWGLYILWAGYSPSYPKSENSEPLFPVVVLCFMLAFFFLFGDRKELKLLIENSITAFVVVPGLLVLNMYRAMTCRFPKPRPQLASLALNILSSSYNAFSCSFQYYLSAIPSPVGRLPTRRLRKDTIGLLLPLSCSYFFWPFL